MIFLIKLEGVATMSNAQLTKKALADALKSIMARVPLNKITVKQLVDHCGLNRQSFYYHFHDVYELLGWIYRTEAVESIAPYRSYQTWSDGFLRIFVYIGNNQAFCMNTLNSLARNHLDAYLYAVTYELVMGVVNEVSSGKKVQDADKTFMANFYTVAFTGLVIQWMRSGMKERPEDIIGRLSELIEGSFLHALERYEAKVR